ncbi:hypothetical protein [Chryseobacterium indologenes]|uniref:DUF4468 domain-containing protein n=1 Tax=Chryseobacterium indologenes TaxID=253 RepID=A0A0N0IWG7_CHRID|nr:hypothetical protein [Chryseobacterium indologenes]KPE51334.1 hypothetical protein AOB46_09295 [Chryseobacterium indologenes]
MKKLLLLLFIAFVTTVYAQNQINYEWGNLDFLKDQTEVNVEMKWNNPLFQAENMTETQYLEKRKAETLAKKGEEAWGKWIAEWENFKKSQYIDYFFKGINGKSKKIAFKSDVKTKYTLIIDTKWIYAGWHGGLIGQEGKLTSDLIFVETDHPEKVVMKLAGDKILGKPQNKDFVWEYGRIAGAYEATGKELGKIVKKLTK